MDNIFDRNHQAIVRKNRGLAKAISDLADNGIILETARSGDITFRKAGVYFQSSYDPWKEAEAQAVEICAKRSDWIILFGLGCGYLLKTLVKRGKEKIIIYEPSLEILKAVVQKVDLSAELSMEKVFVCNAQSDLVALVMNKTEGMDDLLSHQSMPYKQVFPKEILEATNKVMNAHIIHMVGIKTDINSRLDWVENYFANLPYFVKYPSVDILKGFKDVPMVIVGAGPSLKKNAHLLKEIKGRAVIVAAVTAYKPLLGYGVVPDIVIAAEKCDLPEYFTYDESDRNIRLILADVANPRMFERETRNKFIFFNPHCDLGHKFSRLFGATYLPSCGGSVTTVAFDIGVMFGFSPVVFVGQDLAYGDDGRTHIAGGVYVDQKITVDRDSQNVVVNERYIDRNMKELSQVINQKLLWVKGIDGRQIPSKFDWVTFHQWFENYISNAKAMKIPARLINATEGGAYIEGMEHMTLREAIDNCMPAEADVEALMSKAELARPMLNMEAVLGPVEAMQDDLKAIQRLAASIVKEAGVLKKRCAIEKALNGFDKEIKKIRKTEAELFQVAGRATFLWEALSSYTYELKEYLRDDPHEDQFEQFRKDVNAIHVSYKNVGKMCRRLKPMLSKALDAIKGGPPTLLEGKENLEYPVHML
jgi:hypothetical protein